MTETVCSNVLPFDSRRHSGDPEPTASSRALANRCKDRLLSGIATAFDEGLAESQDHLFEMADRASSLDMQNLYFAAHNTLRKRGQELLREFQTQFTSGFDRAVDTRDRPSQAVALGEADELRLVDEDDFERDLAISKLSARASYNCAHQLTALERRIADLLGIRQLDHDDNPLGPKAIFNAFLRSVLELEVGDQIAVALLQEFDRQVGERLPNLYQALNRLLVDNGVLPELPHGPGERFPHGAQTAGGTPPAAGAGAPASYGEPPAPSSSPGIVQPSSPNDFFLQLARGLQAFQSTAPPQMPIAPASLQPASPSVATQLLGALTNLQRGGFNPQDPAGEYGRQLQSGGHGVLRQIHATPIANLAGPADGVTIDIVATLFDLIFSDHQLPDALRAQIARLQIPALKVALIDKSFFSNKRHPARKLLDAIASSAIGRSEDEMPRLVAEVEAIIDAVVGGFESDIGLFAEQLERLETFLAQEDEQAQTHAIQLVEGLERRDRIERARTVVSDQIDRRIKGRDLPALVCDFLSKLWRLFLIRVFVDKGKESASWRGALQTMDDLVWSVSPKHHGKERQQLLTMLPDLLQRLRVGLEGLVIAKGDRDEFFRELVRLHMAAMRADLPQTGPDAPEANTGLVLSAAPAEATESKAPAKNEPDAVAAEAADKSSSTPAQPAPAETGDKYLQAARELDLGAWVEFTSERGTRRTLRLTWISGFKTIYLFAGRQGDDPLSLPTGRLAQRLREGSARILSGDRLTERAVNRLLDATKDELADAEQS